MNINEKYRTISVDDLFIGAEFEFYDGKQWKKHKLTSLDYRVSPTMNLDRLLRFHNHKFRADKKTFERSFHDFFTKTSIS